MEDIKTEFQKLSTEIPLPEFKGMRAISEETFNNVIITAHKTGQINGLSRAEEIYKNSSVNPKNEYKRRSKS